MMGSCYKCSGEDGAAGYLDLNLFGAAVEERLVDEICYQQRAGTDRCTLLEVVACHTLLEVVACRTLLEVVACREECVNTLSHRIKGLTTYHYKAVVQGRYFLEIKENIKEGQVVAHGYFSGN